MLRKPDFKPLQKQDFGDAPSWLDILLSPFNELIQFILDAFKGNISTQNLSLQIIDFTFTPPFQETRFLKSKSDPIQGVWIVNVRKTDGTIGGGYSGLDWVEEGGELVINGIYTSLGAERKVRIFVMY